MGFRFQCHRDWNYATLVWSGLLKLRTEDRSPTELVERRLYRKAPLFDRFVKFNVQAESPAARH